MRKLVALLVALMPITLAAHHSFIDYNTEEVIEIGGELVDVRWVNPHPSFSIDVQGDIWTLDAGGRYALERSGIDASSFSLGTQVRVAGWRSGRSSWGRAPAVRGGAARRTARR